MEQRAYMHYTCIYCQILKELSYCNLMINISWWDIWVVLSLRLSVALCENWNLLSWIIYPSPLSSVGQISSLGGRGAREWVEDRAGSTWRPIRGQGWGAADQSEARHGPRSLGYQEAVVRLLLVLRRKQLVMEEKMETTFWFIHPNLIYIDVFDCSFKIT